MMRLGLLVPFAIGASLFGQAPPQFEVVSIKRSPPVTIDQARSGQFHAGTRISPAFADYGQASLSELIRFAYRIQPYQLVGPTWMASAKFDVTGKLPSGASVDQIPEMLQAMLAQRFHLRVHTETKETPAYALVIAKDGPKLTPRPETYTQAPTNEIVAMKMEDLATRISHLDKPVVDQTGLVGKYLVPDREIATVIVNQLKDDILRRAQTGDLSPASAELWVPGIRDALRKLGLALEPRNLPLSMLVVDSVDQSPSAN